MKNKLPAEITLEACCPDKAGKLQVRFLYKLD